MCSACVTIELLVSHNLVYVHVTILFTLETKSDSLLSGHACIWAGPGPLNHEAPHTGTCALCQITAPNDSFQSEGHDQQHTGTCAVA